MTEYAKCKCGSTKKPRTLYYGRELHGVRCLECGAVATKVVEWFDTAEDAVEGWNKTMAAPLPECFGEPLLDVKCGKCPVQAACAIDDSQG